MESYLMNEKQRISIGKDLLEALMYLESMYSDCPLNDEKLMCAAHVLVQKAYFELRNGVPFEIPEESWEQLAEAKAIFAIGNAMDKPFHE